ncbi:hypothetical protein [Mycoplasma sp. HS2188]|uniref:hypothetical protein n=1 Tax=Mycoplasma sp. HS2188 TaxID=2976765 RepID=UPI0021AA4ADE|nr:hypothetical protein [Mycoplasma sp. HS2188]MCT4470004.1 hypothetical protein [Mycoplasma sp. HS2188]
MKEKQNKAEEFLNQFDDFCTKMEEDKDFRNEVDLDLRKNGIKSKYVIFASKWKKIVESDNVK